MCGGDVWTGRERVPASALAGINSHAFDPHPRCLFDAESMTCSPSTLLEITDPSQNTFGLYRDCRGQTCAEATSRRGNTQSLASAKDPETTSSFRPSSGECGRLVPAQGRVHASTELCLNSVRSSAFRLDRSLLRGDICPCKLAGHGFLRWR